MATTSKLTLLIDLSQRLFNNGLTQMSNRFRQHVQQMRDSYRDFTNQIPMLGNLMDTLSNKWVLLGASVVAVGTGLVRATSLANDWHKQMAEINVTAELTKDELGKLSNKLLDIGTKNVAPLEEVPKAFSRIISAGLNVNQSMKALEPTLRAAKAGFTDIETVASAGIATMMSSGEDINKVYDVLFATVKEGNAEFKDIANYMPKLTPLAKGLGYELSETAGAFASLTTKLSAEQSTTALQGIIRSLSEERIALGQVGKDGTYKSGFKALGIEVHDTTGKIKPLVEIIGMLNDKMAGLSDKQRMEQFGKLGLDQMSTMGFQTLMQDMEGLQKATEATANSQGTLGKAYTDSLTPLEQWGIAQNQLKRSIRKIASGDYYVVVGTDVPYAQLHNEGGTINKVAQVKAHTRKVVIRQRSVNRRGNITTRAIGSKIVNVRAHNRKMNLTMPKRQFLGESELLMKRIEMHVNRELNKELQ